MFQSYTKGGGKQAEVVNYWIAEDFTDIKMESKCRPADHLESAF